MVKERDEEIIRIRRGFINRLGQFYPQEPEAIKKIIMTLLLLTGFLVWLFYPKPEKEEIQVSVSPTPFFLETGNFWDFEIEGKKMRAVWEKVDKGKSLTLIPNFEEEISIAEAVEKYQCDLISNAGFYKENKKPLGFFALEDNILGKNIQSPTFNSYFVYSKENFVKITSEGPQDYDFAFQTGPFLIKDGLPLNLKQLKEEEGRRMVAAVSEESNLFFIAVYDKNSYFNGPNLRKLPKIIENISQKVGENFSQALNLDGGTASGFYTKDFKLANLSPIGSFICVK